MSGLVKAGGVFCILGLMGLSVWLGWRLWVLGFWHISAYPNTQAEVSYIENIPLPEDIAVHARYAYVSSCPERGTSTPTGYGLIYRVSLHREIPVAEPMVLVGWSGEFYPHGLDVRKDRLYVVNDRVQSAPTVEVFRIAGAQLEHVETLQGDRALMPSPNDVLALDEHTCLVTNDSQYGLGWKRSLAIFGGWNRSSMIELGETLAPQVRLGSGAGSFFNGIAQGQEGYLYSDTLRPRGDEQQPKGAFTRTSTLNVRGDNITASEDGRMLLAGHLDLIELARAKKHPQQIKSPSVIMKSADGGYRWQVLFADDGQRYSGATVAVRLPDGRLLLGSAVEHRLAVVRLQ